MSTIKYRGLIVLIIMSLIAGACAQTPQQTYTPSDVPDGQQTVVPTNVETTPTEPKEVTIAVGAYVLNSSYFWLMMPLALGYWEDMGYKVSVEGVGASMDAIQQLVGGNTDFVQADSAAIIQANVKENLPIKVVMETKVIDYALVVPIDSDIQTVGDFKGKIVGVFSLASGSIPLMEGYLKENGLDPDKDIEMIPVGFGPQASEALKRGDIDILILWGAALAQLENLGHEFRYFRSEKWLQMPEFSLATNLDLIEQDPQMVVDIVKGALMGMAFTQENPECAIKVHWANWPETKPADVDEETALQWDKNIINANLESMNNVFKLHGSNLWGVATPDEFDRLQEFMLSAGLIDKTIDPSIFIINTPGFWDEVNDFDREAIIQQARACDF